jgi:UMF1 family MFS transporter
MSRSAARAVAIRQAVFAIGSMRLLIGFLIFHLAFALRREDVTSIGLGALIGGRVDDRLGPKMVIVGGLTALVVVGIGIVSVPEPAMFWVGGLILASLVGPIQSASRTFLARITPHGLEGEAFGLYATMGRAVSFTGPLAFSGFIALFGTQRAGMVGILLVLFLGLIAVLGVRPPERPSGVAATAAAPR